MSQDLESPGAAAADFKPRGWCTITPRIVVPQARLLAQFLREVFNATGDYLADAPAIMVIGDSRIMISDAGVRDAATAFLYVYVANTDETYMRALECGAQMLEAPIDLPYGDRRAMVKDRWGNTWQIATRLPVAR